MVEVVLVFEIFDFELLCVNLFVEVQDCLFLVVVDVFDVCKEELSFIMMNSFVCYVLL